MGALDRAVPAVLDGSTALRQPVENLLDGPGADIDVLIDLSTDELFRKPTLAFAEARAARGRPVWAYEFDFPTPAHDGRLGAPHCLDLPFGFDNFGAWSHAPFLAGMDTRVRDCLARTMHRAWISFVRTGDPNHPAMPRWDRYDLRSRTTMRFDTVTTAVSHLTPH
ncbi:carboxylesterase family protein [Streptomyces sp. MB09-01]|uniref:carboxylesterase family protein n=1 Tax=Streptomyces sp. MB09-01 TaxID=3028666 RepID=UPI0029A5BAB0|nr:carboxylesterase family protein [Streptomyces sp. MB09-01]MDX3536547.1 carboxylesterase family protein [Streptomyces sp. MB09-01]